MKDLAIKRHLDEETRKHGVLIGSRVYSLHITDRGEAVITDNEDYSKIYAVQTLDFYNLLCGYGGDDCR